MSRFDAYADSLEPWYDSLPGKEPGPREEPGSRKEEMHGHL